MEFLFFSSEVTGVTTLAIIWNLLGNFRKRMKNNTYLADSPCAIPVCMKFGIGPAGANIWIPILQWLQYREWDFDPSVPHIYQSAMKQKHWICRQMIWADEKPMYNSPDCRITSQYHGQRLAMGRVLLQPPSHVTMELIWSFMHLSFMSVEVVFRVCDLLAVSLFAQERELCIFYFGRLIICFVKSYVALKVYLLPLHGGGRYFWGCSEMHENEAYPFIRGISLAQSATVMSSVPRELCTSGYASGA